MRYQREKSQDWVIIEGAAAKELAELDVLYGKLIAPAQALVAELVTDCCFTNAKGEPVDPRQNYRRLTLPQWNWLRDQITQAANDEVLDPEV